MVKAVFAGSFDPPTNGHLDIINRTYKIFDQIDVVVSVTYKVGEYLPIPDTGLSQSITIILIGLILISLGAYTINYVRQE